MPGMANLPPNQKNPFLFKAIKFSPAIFIDHPRRKSAEKRQASIVF